MQKVSIQNSIYVLKNSCIFLCISIKTMFWNLQLKVGYFYLLDSKHKKMKKLFSN